MANWLPLHCLGDSHRRLGMQLHGVCLAPHAQEEKKKNSSISLGYPGKKEPHKD